MAALLLLPSVLAESGSGRLVSEGTIAFPHDTTVEGKPLAAFTDDMDGLLRISLVASKARLLEVSRPGYVDATGTLNASGPSRRVETPLTDARFELAAVDENGWIGLYPADSARMSMVANVEALLDPVANSQVGDNENEIKEVSSLYDEAFGEGRPNDPRYRRFISLPHLLMSSPGVATFEGRGILKVYGPDLLLESRERDGLLRTGLTSDGASPVRNDVQEWILIEYEGGTLQVDAVSPLTIALDSASVAWSGAATFSTLSGTLKTSTRTYAPDGRSATLAGDLTAKVSPVLDSDEVVAYVDLQGTLSSTTLTPQASAAPVRAESGSSGTTPWLLFGGLAVLAMGGASVATAVAARRRVQPVVAAPKAAGGAPASAPQPPLVTLLPATDDGLQADDCIRFADDAAVERRWARALHWAQRARVLAPNNARIRADEGEYLFQLGLFEESLQAFAEASRLDTSEGYADYRGAQAAVAAGRPVDEVLAWLERALDRSPDLVGDLELFKEFDGLRGMPGYDAMVRRAYDRLGIDPANPF